MKRFTKITIPALALIMSIAPSFAQDNTYLHVDLENDEQEEVVKRLEPIEPLKIEPIGIKLKEIEIPKLEIKPLAIPKAVTNIESEENEAEEVALEKAEEKKEEEEEEKIEIAENKEEEKEVVEKKEEIAAKPEVVRNTTYEELTGLVCRQQVQMDNLTRSIDGLIQSMDKQLELINSLTQLMMANQLAASSTPQYGPNLFQQPTLMSNFEAMLFGQRMGSLMNVFSPLQSFNGFGFNAPQVQAPNNTYNYYGYGQSQAQAQMMVPQAQVMPQYTPYNFGNIDNSTRTLEIPGPQMQMQQVPQTFSI